MFVMIMFLYLKITGFKSKKIFNEEVSGKLTVRKNLLDLSWKNQSLIPEASCLVPNYAIPIRKKDLKLINEKRWK